MLVSILAMAKIRDHYINFSLKDYNFPKESLLFFILTVIYKTLLHERLYLRLNRCPFDVQEF